MRASALLLSLCAAGLVWSALGCDTVAEISFRNEKLKSATVLGFRPLECTSSGTSLCSPPGCGRLYFVMEATAGYIEPNMQLAGLDGRLTPGVNFGIEDEIGFERSYLFQLDEKGLDKSCATEADCATGFACMTKASLETLLPSGSVVPFDSVCARQASVTVREGSIEFRAVGNDPQPENDRTAGYGKRGMSIVMAIDNSGSIAGKDPVNGNIVPGAATDTQKQALAAANSFPFSVELLSSYQGKVEYALFELAGTGQSGVRDKLALDPSLSRTFTSSIDALRRNLGTMTATQSGATPLWEAALMAASVFPESGSSNYARHVLAFVDSGPDGSLADRTVDGVVAALGASDVQSTMSIVHLDSLEPTLQTALDARSGPLADYAKAACELGGFYTYETYPRAVDAQMQRQAFGYEAVWSVEVEVAAVAAQPQPLSALDPGWYRLATSMQLRVVEENARVDLILDKVSTFGNETADTRLLFNVAAAE